MIGGWLMQHKLSLAQVLGRMWRTRLATMAMMTVIGIALCLPATLYVAIDNLQRLAGGFDDAPQISLFLALDASDATVKDLAGRLRGQRDIASYRFVGRDEAWQELQKNSGLGDVASGLEHNPLPDAYVIHTKSRDPDKVEALRQQMQKWPGVELAQVDAAWVKRLHTLLQLGEKVVMVVAGLLGFALLAITGNSIRLQIVTQRDEIELARLIGATDRFIRRPFLYAGSLYGLGGGLAALAMLAAALWLFNLSVADLARQYGSDFRLVLPGPDLCAGLLGISALLGWIGAYWSVSRSLASLDQD